MILLENITKTYMVGTQEVHALNNISMPIHAGEFIAILGKSGSGKSTLLNQIGLIDSPTSGKIIIEGKNMIEATQSQKSEYRMKHFGFIFQDHILFPELNVQENIMLPALAAGIDQESAREKAIQLCNVLDIGNRTNHRPYELSGGQKQRVAVARALINNPIVIFADEPTANLDSTNSTNLLEYLKKVNTEFHTTIIMVTHDEDSSKYVDRVVRLKDGELITNPIKARPISSFERTLRKCKSRNMTNNRLISMYKQARMQYNSLPLKLQKKYYKELLDIYKKINK